MEVRIINNVVMTDVRAQHRKRKVGDLGRGHSSTSATWLMNRIRVVVLLVALLILPGREDQASAVPRTLFRPRTADSSHWPHEAREYSSSASTSTSRRRSSPLEVFEVAKPADVVHTTDTERCSQVLLRHAFGNTINEPAIVRTYSPQCSGHPSSRWVLKWTASCAGRQFDRIAAVWLGGVEILRTCTAEPVKQPGIQWTVEKDVTRFASLWNRPQTLTLELANVVNEDYTGIYDVTLSVHVYTHEMTSSPTRSSSDKSVADVVLPFPTQHWFRIRDEGDAQSRRVKLPLNAYKAVIELCVSFHELDEFWYVNPPTEYNEANNITDSQAAANGAFREILVAVDGLLAGVVYPFPVIYTGGVNPYFWRPVSGIGSFVLPSYDIDITPFLGRDGGEHEIMVSVTDALPSWLLGLNLHVWVDESFSTTRASMVSHFGSSFTSKRNSEMLKFLDGTFHITASRWVSHSGWVASSKFGNVTTSVEYSSRFSHSLVYSDTGNAISVRHESVSEKKVVVKSEEKLLLYEHSMWRFPLRLSMNQKRCGEGEDYFITATVDHAWEEEQSRSSTTGGYGGPSFFSSLKNRQKSSGKLFVPQSGDDLRGAATTKQSLVYDGSGGCYFRSLGVTNKGSFLFDHSHTQCT